MMIIKQILNSYQKQPSKISSCDLSKVHIVNCEHNNTKYSYNKHKVSFSNIEVQVVRRTPIVILFVLFYLVCGSLTPYDFNLNSGINEIDLVNNDQDLNLMDVNPSLSQEELQGTLDPVIIEQTGNKTTSTIHAETDSNTNVKTNLLIDTGNNWVGSKASVNLWDLNRLYVENGSVTEGITGVTQNPAGSISFYPYGWDATSGSPDPGMDMIVEYSNQEIALKSNGYGSPGSYFYANGSYVYWFQTVNNTPYLENFILNFDYFYNRGPGSHPNVTLRVFIDDTLIWTNTSETILDAVWQNSGNILVDLTGIGSEFEFKIGLYFSGDIVHSHQFIEFTLDDIQFVGETPPTFDDANINLNIGGESVAIAGTSTGQASITNSSNWITDNVPIELTTDLSYSFEYTGTMLSSRYVNSTRTTVQLDDGVHYTSLPNENPLLTFYTFVGTIPDIDDFTLVIRFPEDWTNVTVLNPSGIPKTSSCIIHIGNITIPNNLILANLGWWEVRLESPNYLRTIQTFKLNEPALTWLPDSVYRIPNKTKLIIEIGGALPLPTAPQEVGISWYMPNGTVWFSESISGGSLGAINSSQLEFGSLNATTGIWQAEVAWTNGTEVAFGNVNFEVHHRTSLTSHESLIDAESGLSISNFVYFQDLENGMFLMDPAVTVTANWSMTIVNFLPDAIQNRWVGTFDTSLIGPGIHLVVVNASGPFLDDASCTFLVTISFTDNKLMIDNPTPVIGIGDKHLVTFSYSDFFGFGISGANVSIDYTGAADGISWGDLNDLGGGNYSLEFTAVHSDSYAITISASKEYYEEGQGALFILVGERSTNLSLENGTAAHIGFGEHYRLVIRYVNGSGFGLEGAPVSIIHTTPETGISYSNATDEGNGYYSFILTPSDTRTYTLLIRVALADYETQQVSFTLTATEISTQLQIVGTSSPSSVGVEQLFELLVFFEEGGSSPANISMADIRLNFTSFESLDYTITRLSLGVDGYLITLNASQIGSYKFTIYANKTGHQSDFETFTLFVVARGMTVIMDAPLWIRLSSLNLSLQLLEADTSNSISGAFVSYWLLRSGGIVMEGNLTEISPGVYVTSIMPQWSDGAEYSIRILAEKANFELDDVYQFHVLQYTPPEILWQIMVATYGPPIVLVAGVAVLSLSGRVVYRRKKKAEFAKDLANKRRFDDADNVIGAIVMHKSSGLPIYSKIVKGGFEEGIVAAFISAVTHFREEFEMMDEDTIRVIPISDIIRAVQTRNLICAFVTVRSASMEHNRKIESFGKEVSEYLDDFFSERKPPSNQDSRITEIVDYVYDSTMDGPLLKYHKISSSQKLPKRYLSIEQVLLDADSGHCTKPIRLSKAVSKYGVSEARGCTLVSEAVEKRLIVPCEEHELPEKDIDLYSFLNEKSSDGSD